MASGEFAFSCLDVCNYFFSGESGDDREESVLGDDSSSGSMSTKFTNFPPDCYQKNISDVIKCLIDFCEDDCEAPLSASSKNSLVHSLPQLLLALLGIILNVVGVYMKRKKRRNNVFPSEYLLISLCISDLIFCLFVCIVMVLSILEEKIEVIHQIYLGEITISIIQFTILASIFHVIAIAFERLFAISLPLRHRIIACKRNIKKSIAIIWVLTILVNIALLGCQFRDGRKPWDHKNYKEPLSIVGILMYLSAVLLLLIYSILTRKLAQQKKFTREIRRNQLEANSKHPSMQRDTMEKTVFFLSVFIASAFIVCTVPFATLRALSITEASLTLDSVCEDLLICNSILNPLIYFWRDHWLKLRRKKQNRHSNETNSNGVFSGHRRDPVELSRRKCSTVDFLSEDNRKIQMMSLQPEDTLTVIPNTQILTTTTF